MLITIASTGHDHESTAWACSWVQLSTNRCLSQLTRTSSYCIVTVHCFLSQINIVLFLFFNSITRNHKNHLQGNAFVNRHGNRHSGWLSDIWQCLFIVISVYELNNREIASFAIKMAKICAPKITKLSSKFETKRWPTWVHNLLPSVLTCHVDMASELVTRRDLIATVSDTSSSEDEHWDVRWLSR